MILIEDSPTGGRAVGTRRSFVAQGTHTCSPSCREGSCSFRGWRASSSFVPLAVRCVTCLAQLGFRAARVWLLRPKLPVWSWRLRGSSRDEGSSLLVSVGL